MKNSNLPKYTKLLGFAAIILLSGCAEISGWQPTIDAYGDPNAYRINQDIADCKALASHASGSVKETLMDSGAGALLGAAGGAITGAFLGNPGIGAGVGAAAGGFGGGAYGGLNADQRYKNAYNNCMSGRGHRVLR